MNNKIIIFLVFLLLAESVMCEMIFSQDAYELDQAVFRTIGESLRQIKKERVLLKLNKIRRLEKSVMEDPQPEEAVFYPVDSEIDISRANGKTGNKHLDKKQIKKILRVFETHRTSDNSIDSFKIADTYAYEWWITNNHINYNPLMITLVDYHPMDKNKKVKKIDRKQFFTVYPFSPAMNSQIITFGFEKEFFHGNKRMEVERIVLTYKGESYTLSPSSCVPVLFDMEGEHEVTAEVRFNDNSVYKTSFSVFLEKMADGSWFNSTVDAAGKVMFRIKRVE